MKKVFALLLSVLTISLFVSMGMHAVAAAKPIELVSITVGGLPGEYFNMVELPSGLFKIDFLSVQQFTGDIEGTFYNPGHGIYNPRSGVWFLEAVGTVEDCVVHLPSGDLYGTITIENWATYIDTGLIDINYAAIIDGTGDLKNMHGTAVVDWTVWPPAIHWSIHFDP